MLAPMFFSTPALQLFQLFMEDSLCLKRQISPLDL